MGEPVGSAKVKYMAIAIASFVVSSLFLLVFLALCSCWTQLAFFMTAFAFLFIVVCVIARDFQVDVRDPE